MAAGTWIVFCVSDGPSCPLLLPPPSPSPPPPALPPLAAGSPGSLGVEERSRRPAGIGCDADIGTTNSRIGAANARIGAANARDVSSRSWDVVPLWACCALWGIPAPAPAHPARLPPIRRAAKLCRDTCQPAFRAHSSIRAADALCANTGHDVSSCHGRNGIASISVRDGTGGQDGDSRHLLRRMCE